MFLKGKKSGFYRDSYLIQNDIEDNYVKFGKNMKASESFKKIILNNDENEINNNYINNTLLNNNNIHKKKNIEMYNYKITFNYVNDFNVTILKDKNWGNSSLVNNNSSITSHNWNIKRFKSKIFKNNNPYSTIRLREKKSIDKNIIDNDKYFNISNPKSNINEKEFIFKYLNKRKEK